MVERSKFSFQHFDFACGILLSYWIVTRTLILKFFGNKQKNLLSHRFHWEDNVSYTLHRIAAVVVVAEVYGIREILNDFFKAQTNNRDATIYNGHKN